MNSLKTAVVLAGAVVMACAATSAVAHEGPGSTADGLAGAAQRIADGPREMKPQERPLYMVGTPDEGALSRVTQAEGRPVTQKTDGSLLGGGLRLA